MPFPVIVAFETSVDQDQIVRLVLYDLDLKSPPKGQRNVLSRLTVKPLSVSLVLDNISTSSFPFLMYMYNVQGLTSMKQA